LVLLVVLPGLAIRVVSRLRRARVA
jgi:hypothetical protein